MIYLIRFAASHSAALNKRRLPAPPTLPAAGLNGKDTITISAPLFPLLQSLALPSRPRGPTAERRAALHGVVPAAMRRFQLHRHAVPAAAARRSFATTVVCRRMREKGDSSGSLPPHPVDAVLAHVRPPLPAMTIEAKDRIARAVTSKARALSGGGKTKAADFQMKNALRASLLEAINDELVPVISAGSGATRRESLDVSLDNHAVELMLSHHHRFRDKISPQAAAALTKKLKEPPFSLSLNATSGALAEDLIHMLTLLRHFFDFLPPHVVQNVSATLSDDQQDALKVIEMNVRRCFTDNNVFGIPWVGDGALQTLARRRRTIADIMEETHTRFFGDLAAVFGKKVMLCGGRTVEFQVENGRVGSVYQGPPHISEEGARFRRPPHCVIVRDNLPALRSGVLTVLVGASGAGKTMAALLTAMNTSECVLYFKGRDVFKSASGNGTGEKTAVWNRRVAKDVVAAVKKALAGFTSDLHPCPCAQSSSGSQGRCQCPPLSVTVVIDEAGGFGPELRGLCAACPDVCAAIAALLHVSAVHRHRR